MIQLEPRGDGVVLPVRAQPGARAGGVRGEQDGALRVCVTQIAEKGKANRGLVEVLSKALGLRKSQFEILVGETSRRKKVLVRDISPDQLRARLDKLLARS